MIKPVLTKAHIEKRLQYSRDCLMNQDLSKFIFVDEESQRKEV